MNWIMWIILVLAIQVSGWMVFDGVRALIVGDYITPKSGPYAGKLGPWAELVSRIGIDPRSTFMKIFFVLYGLTWITFGICLVAGVHWAKWAMLIVAICSLWYLYIGTFFSLLQIILFAIKYFLKV